MSSRVLPLFLNQYKFFCSDRESKLFEVHDSNVKIRKVSVIRKPSIADEGIVVSIVIP